MAIDIFLKLYGVQGEAQDADHKDEIDILKWSWSMAQSGTAHLGSGAGTGKVAVRDLVLKKYIDRSTPILMKNCCLGTHFSTGLLTIRKAGEHPLEYATLALEEVFITSVETGDLDGGDRILELVTLNFRAFTISYKQQTDEGVAGPAVDFGWDIARNTRI